MRQRTQTAVRCRLDASLGAGRTAAIFTSEGLSLLRSPAELERLHALLGAGRHPVKIVCVLRRPADYLTAYRRQILKLPGRKPSADPASALYVEPDSWLADFPALLKAYGDRFGHESVTVVDYDAEMKRVGDVLPASLQALGLPEALIPAPNAVRRQNVDSTWIRLRRQSCRILRALSLR